MSCKGFSFAKYLQLGYWAKGLSRGAYTHYHGLACGTRFDLVPEKGEVSTWRPFTPAILQGPKMLPVCRWLFPSGVRCISPGLSIYPSGRSYKLSRLILSVNTSSPLIMRHVFFLKGRNVQFLGYLRLLHQLGLKLSGKSSRRPSLLSLFDSHALAVVPQSRETLEAIPENEPAIGEDFLAKAKRRKRAEKPPISQANNDSVWKMDQKANCFRSYGMLQAYTNVASLSKLPSQSARTVEIAKKEAQYKAFFEEQLKLSRPRRKAREKPRLGLSGTQKQRSPSTSSSSNVREITPPTKVGSMVLGSSAPDSPLGLLVSIRPTILSHDYLTKASKSNATLKKYHEREQVILRKRATWPSSIKTVEIVEGICCPFSPGPIMDIATVSQAFVPKVGRAVPLMLQRC
uniref:Uncharacterized protein n=1 Tax=Cannabis sativa TaxID=3483 RepID=A0A803PKK2_CANSA